MILGRLCLTTARVRDPETNYVLLEPLTPVVIVVAIDEETGVGVVPAYGYQDPDYAIVVPLNTLAYTAQALPGGFALCAN
jgi:hypothetical protein